MTAHKMIPEYITIKETGNERERFRKTQFLVLPVLMVVFLHDLASGLGFATGSQIPAYKSSIKE